MDTFLTKATNIAGPLALHVGPTKRTVKKAKTTTTTNKQYTYDI